MRDLKAMRATVLLRLDDLIAHRVPDQLAHGVDLELAHDVRAMRFRRLHADAENDGHFFAAFALRQQLNDLSFPWRQPVANRLRDFGYGATPGADALEHDL